MSNRKCQHYWLTAAYSALRMGEYKYMAASITDDDTDVLNPGGFTGTVQHYGATAGCSTSTWIRKNRGPT